MWYGATELAYDLSAQHTLVTQSHASSLGVDVVTVGMAAPILSQTSLM